MDLDLLVIAIILLFTYFTGSIIEKKHFKNIKKREIALYNRPYVNFSIKKWSSKRKVASAELVTGEVVISGDYFKTFIAGLKNMFGGRLTSFESLMDRARREALLRMREKARNANMIINVKLETMMINDINSSKQGALPGVAVIAYGTAITYAKK